MRSWRTIASSAPRSISNRYLFTREGRFRSFKTCLKLCRDIQDICTSLKDIEAECERLTLFGTTTRYPGSGMQPGEEHMTRVDEWMENIRLAVLRCLD